MCLMRSTIAEISWYQLNISATCRVWKSEKRLPKLGTNDFKCVVMNCMGTARSEVMPLIYSDKTNGTRLYLANTSELSDPSSKELRLVTPCPPIALILMLTLLTAATLLMNDLKSASADALHKPELKLALNLVLSVVFWLWVKLLTVKAHMPLLLCALQSQSQNRIFRRECPPEYWSIRATSEGFLIPIGRSLI